ncbi:MAG: sugar phosphate isomerase/epimerase, partial [Armatimonadetes bacterium]|nr:sugar phosphate isomerase/epimerase [Armatimonadota bacterium]
MRVSMLSDEISSDPITAAELAAEWGLKHFELRMYYRQRAPQGMSDRDMEWLRQAWADFGIDCPSISPGLFKVRLDDPSIGEHRGPLRERCFELAEALGAQIIVAFPPIMREGESWWDWPPEVVDDFRETAEMAQKRGLKIALENEPVCYGGSGQALAKLISEINHPALGANWDPGNHTHATGEDHSDAYEMLRPFHIHTHVKDYAGKHSRAIPPGEGAVGWVDQLRKMKQNGY